MTEPQFCDGVDWTAHASWQSTWCCPAMMVEYDNSNGDSTAHLCAASSNHAGDHCCLEGHRWPQSKPRPRWRSRLRARLSGAAGGRDGGH